MWLAGNKLCCLHRGAEKDAQLALLLGQVAFDLKKFGAWTRCRFSVTLSPLTRRYHFKPCPLSFMLKVEGCPSGESPVTPRKRLHSAEDARCSSRPPPEGAGSVPITESEEKGGFCQQCRRKVTELKKQAQALADQSLLKVRFCEGVKLLTCLLPPCAVHHPDGHTVHVAVVFSSSRHSKHIKK